MIIENKNRLGFDPRTEVGYLTQFSRDLKKQQLETEISTALSELLLSEYSHDYLWKNGQIVDQSTGIKAQDLTKNCDYERGKIKKIEEELVEGRDLVVSVSPKNEELDYPDNMVDFWKRGEGDKLTLLRFKVDMSREQLEDFEELNKDGYKLSDLVRMLSLAKSEESLSVKTIEEITRNLVARFNSEFGGRLFADAELITRLFIATRLEIEGVKKDIGIVPRRDQRNIVDSRLQNYLYGQLKTAVVAGGGCGGRSLSGQFASEGIIIIKNVSGISFRKGRTEGLSYCSECGCWYSGDKCPVCN